MDRAALLQRYLAEFGQRAFAWDGCNCCDFAAGWVAVATGHNPMNGLPITPTRVAAYRLVSSMGGSLADAITSRLGYQAIAPEMAQIGDIMLVMNGKRGGTVGINCGRIIFARDRQGRYVHMPASAAANAWRLPSTTERQCAA